MREKQLIKASPDNMDRPFEHMLPIVEALIEDGNVLRHENPFFLDKDGWRCDFEYPINFDLIETRFDLPKTIYISKDHGSILDKNSWVEIQGGASTDPKCTEKKRCQEP